MQLSWLAFFVLSHSGFYACFPVQKEFQSITQQDVSFAEKYLQQFYSMDGILPHRRKRNTGAFQSRIRKLQDFFGLNVTGSLNPETLALMKEPRCGVPDVKNYEFYANKSKWMWNTITYRLLNYTSKLTPRQVDDAIQMSVKVWSDVTPLNFVKTDSADADIVITFATKDHGDFFPFDGPRGILGHAYEPGEGIGGDVHLDEEEFWTMGYVKKGYDLFNVAAHELGHALGLGHSRDPNALMYPKYKFYQPEGYQLSPDDLKGIQSLYGPRTRHMATVTIPQKCDPSLSFDATTTIGSGVLFIKDGYMWLRKFFAAENMEGFLQSYFPKLPTNINAAYEIPERRMMYLFTGTAYWSINTLTMEMSSSSIYDFGFPSTVIHIDAAVYFKRKKATLFFVGEEYWSYNEIFSVMETGYPKKIEDDFPGINNKVNATLELEGFICIFAGSQAYVYNYEEKIIMSSMTANAWLGCHN
ncbi:matrix metalloproteinase-20-like [Rhinatrema bivittatum]|uniref:matrix metalloproteinase-20-like n=1 Tax=Rhinatrema bivittatum TaxID=194408 RepID=UPI00112DB83D|nr:matrix metalloproteinase-20-like [Rhinatrema bivittatum]